jgi:hypothetical protein
MKIRKLEKTGEEKEGNQKEERVTKKNNKQKV